jgi:hydroxymethylglutaryl-CoA synthase
MSAEQLSGKRLVLFSYGSGLAATMYSMRVATDCGPKSPLSSLLANVRDIPDLLARRTVVSPTNFEKTMKLREKTHHQAPYVPQGCPATDLFPLTYYLVSVDNKHRRLYQRVGCIDTTSSVH